MTRGVTLPTHLHVIDPVRASPTASYWLFSLHESEGLLDALDGNVLRTGQELDTAFSRTCMLSSPAENAPRAQLADAGALQGLAGHRHQARWDVAGIKPQLPLFAGIDSEQEADAGLPEPSVPEDLYTDYATLGTTLGPHPLLLLRETLRAMRCKSSHELFDIEHGRHIAVAGLVTGRQKPSTASGVVFVTLEDEHGMINVVVWADLGERQRQELLNSQLMQVNGRPEYQGGVRHVIAGRLRNLTHLLTGLDVRSRDFQ